MANDKKYELLADGEDKVVSIMGILPSDKNTDISSSKIEHSLKNNRDFSLISFSPAEDFDKDIVESVYSSHTIKLSYKGKNYTANIRIVSTKHLNVDDYGFANHIDQESLKTAKEQSKYVEVSMYFGDDNLVSFHLQMKIMNAVVADASVVIDFMSYRLLSAKWLKMSTNSQIPPSPDYLYTLHCVYDQVGDKKYYWFHTHGLQRCGSVELEMLNITQGIEEMNTLMNMAVKKFLTDPACEKQKFTIAFDGMDINLCWLRWEEAILDMPTNIPGSLNDRKEEDNIHNGAGGVLYAVEDGNMISPEIYTKTLSDNPVFFISNEETDRMSALAKERFVLFKKAFEKENPWKNKNKSLLKKLFGSSKQDELEWAFLVKLGLPVDGNTDEKEHLWFEVMDINDSGDMEVKLLNKPYWISSLKEGKKYYYPSNVLTDWLIYSPDNTYTSDSVYQLDIMNV